MSVEADRLASSSSVVFLGQLAEVASNLKDADWLRNAKTGWKRFRLEFVKTAASQVCWDCELKILPESILLILFDFKL